MSDTARTPRIDWQSVVETAATIVESYDTGVTLRQLFYRLVSRELIPNSQTAYKRLSSVTAEARRKETFPDLIDNTRLIRRPGAIPGPEAAMAGLKAEYRRDRTENQEHSIYVAVEKNALATQIAHWYREKGIPVLAFGGYPSQTFVNDIRDDIERQERPAVLIYGGDFDPTGVDILRDFENRTDGFWESVDRVALNPDQITKYKLPPLPGKHWDPRAAGFIAQFGKLMQVELDALPPDVLKKIYDDAVFQYWDEEAFKETLKQEEIDKKKLLDPEQIEQLIVAMRELKGSGDVLGSEVFERRRKKKLEEQSTKKITASVMDDLVDASENAEMVLNLYKEVF